MSGGTFESERSTMPLIRPVICTTWLVLLGAATAAAEPAYVTSTVNLRASAGTSSEIVAKIPGGSLVDTSNCSDWCEVTWQDKHGFAIASALDRSGRVPGPRPVLRGPVIEDDDEVVAGPPAVYAAPGTYYYGHGYCPYCWGYGRR